MPSTSRMKKSTRRFSARPSGVLLSPFGTVLPTHIEKKSEKKAAAADGAATKGQGDGEADAVAKQQQADQADASAKDLTDAVNQTKAQHEADQQAAAKKKADAADAEAAKKKSDGEAAKKKPGEGDGEATPTSKKAVAKKAFLAAKDWMMGDLTASVREIGGAAKDMYSLVHTLDGARLAALDIVVHMTDSMRKEAKQRVQKLQDKQALLVEAVTKADKNANTALDGLATAEKALKAAQEHEATTGEAVEIHKRLDQVDAKRQAAEAVKALEKATKALTDTDAAIAKIAQRMLNLDGAEKGWDLKVGPLQLVKGNTDADIAAAKDKEAKAKTLDPDERAKQKEAMDGAAAEHKKATKADKKATKAAEKAKKALEAAELKASKAKTAHDDLVKRHGDVETERKRLELSATTQREKARKLADKADADAAKARELEKNREQSAREAARLRAERESLTQNADKLRKQVADAEAAEKALPSAKTEKDSNSRAATDKERSQKALEDKSSVQEQTARAKVLDLDKLRGQNVELGVGADGQPVTGQIARVQADGVMILEPDGKRRLVPWDQITGPHEVVEGGQTIRQAEAEAKRLHELAEQDGKAAKEARERAAKASQEAEGHEQVISQAPAELRANMRTEADQKSEHAAGDVTARLKAAEDLANKPIAEDVAALKQNAALLNGQAGDLRTAALADDAAAVKAGHQATKLAESVSSAKTKFDALDTAVTTAKTNAKDAEKAADAAKAEAEKKGTAKQESADAYDKDTPAEDQAAMHQTMGNANADKGFWTRLLTNPSSGNAMGGVGSTYKEFLSKLESGEVWAALIGIIDRKQYHQEKAAANEKAEPSEKSPALVAREALLADEEKKKEEAGLAKKMLGLWNDKGKMAGDFITKQLGGPLLGDFLLEPPPKDREEMDATFGRAQVAMESSAAHHAKAFEAYTAEEQVSALIADEEELQKHVGDRVKADAEAQKEPIKKGKKDERDRKAKMKEKQAKEKANMDNSLIQTMTEKMMKDSEYLDDSPNPELVKTAGSKSGGAQDDAHDSTQAATDTSVDSSDKQMTFLEQLEANQTKIADFVKQNQDQLALKIEDDKAQRTAIQTNKAEYLTTSQAKREEAELESLRFTVDMNEMAIWAAKYKAKRLAATGAA